MSKRTAAALVLACVLVAGCSGPFADDGDTERATTDLPTNTERVVAAPPPNGTTTGSGGAQGPTDDGTEPSTTERATTEPATMTMGASATVTSDGAPATSGTVPGDADATVTRQSSGTPARTTGGATTRSTVATYDRDVGYEVRVSNGGATPRNVSIRVVARNDSAVAFAATVRLPPNGLREFDVDFPHAGTYEVRVRVGNEAAVRQWDVPSRDPDDAFSVHVSPEGRVYVGFVEI